MSDNFTLENDVISFSNLDNEEFKFNENNRLNTEEINKIHRDDYLSTFKSEDKENTLLFNNLSELIDESEDQELLLKVLDSL